MTIDHSGARVLVTGSGAGIGREVARWFAKAGATVAVVDIRSDAANETVTLINEEGTGEAFAVIANVRDDQKLESMVAESVERLGGLHVAVNNIGMLGPRGTGPLIEMDGEMWRDVLDQNLVLTALCMRAEAQVMVDQGSGVIINVSSGETTRPSPFLAGYGAAKAGIDHLTRTAAVEWGPSGIRVLAIAPGTTLTDTVSAVLSDEQVTAIAASNPLRRLGDYDELGRLAVFLASDLARNITGQLILADAGAHLSRDRPGIPASGE